MLNSRILDHAIGEIIRVNSTSIEIDLTMDVSKAHINIHLKGYPVSIHQYVYAYLPNHQIIICRIYDIFDKTKLENKVLFKSKNEIQYSAEANFIAIYNPDDKKSDIGINTFPIIGSEVFVCSSDMIETLFEQKKDTSINIEIGCSYINPMVKVKANPNILFGKHLGIFGNTGTGKSCTLTSLIQGFSNRIDYFKESNFSKPKIILFDVNGEYKNTFNNSNFISKSNLKLPHSILEKSEYCKLFQASPGIQAPILEKVLENSFTISNLNSLLKIQIGSDKKTLEWCNTLFERIDSINLRKDLISIIDCDIKLNTIDDIFKNEFLINIIEADFDSLEFEIITFLICKYVYLKNSRRESRKDIIIVFDEAHRYINEKSDDNRLGNYYVERLAREGRKFGIGLVIASQRPSELSKTVISQCNSFIVHRIGHKADLEFIYNVMNTSHSSIIKSIPSLQKQYAVAFGESFNTPDIIKIADANPTPDSSDPELFKIEKPKE